MHGRGAASSGRDRYRRFREHGMRLLGGARCSGLRWGKGAKRVGSWAVVAAFVYRQEVEGPMGSVVLMIRQSR